MIVGKDRRGVVRYRGWDTEGKKIDLDMKIKNIEAAMLIFTFRESTALATARDRLVVDGEVAHACAIVRILDAVEVYLLPKIIARLAVKRYPDWPFRRKYLGRALVYVRTIFGF
jgi:aldehyde:ferredoxin oxidoreductase